MNEVNPKQAMVCAKMCASANVRRASRAVTRLYGEFLADVGIEPTQYSLLVACSLAEGATVSKLAEVFAMERSALARNLAVLQKRGLVDVRPGKDRRTRMVTLTTTGEAAFAEAYPRWRAAQKRIEQTFGQERLQRLISELRVLTEATQATP
jgi:DNA-binding MarR family transcriptional regulator